MVVLAEIIVDDDIEEILEEDMEEILDDDSDAQISEC